LRRNARSVTNDQEEYHRRAADLASLCVRGRIAGVPQRVTMYLDAGQPFGNVAGRLS
jgi:hypothetical protein